MLRLDPTSNAAYALVFAGMAAVTVAPQAIAALAGKR